MSINTKANSDLSSGQAPSENPELSLQEKSLIKKWDQEQFEEAATRRAQRGWVFCTTYVITIMLFFTFGAYVWASIGKDGNTVDHMLLWLLAALPVGLTLLMAKLAADPKQTEEKPAWTDGLVGVLSDAVGVAKDYVKKLTDKP